MSRNLSLSLATLALLGLSSSVAHAQSFTTLYDFFGSAGTQASNAATAQPTNGAASVLDRGAGLTTNAGSNSINSANWSTGAIDLTDYYGFTITPNVGFSVSLTSIAYTERRSGTGPQNFEIRSSVDGFTTALTGTSYTNAVTTDTARTFTLSGIPALQSVNSAITLRIYGFGATGTAGTYRLLSPGAGQGLTLSGEFKSTGATSAPEPATFLLVGSGLVLLARRRRS